ncbi:hypothetical protein [Jeongeupia chitinilytica]|uniref:3'-5' exonuclease n=1 Tax=Jeongeupia chitinilytica TaxID=1041641 RepID=A0ABQ3GUN1_9NEIS|nr:hypothetical protein [Jeongeupia chitinilytica]GHD55004.1 hypothetical protein GCM10007350_00080 [Jeongeupia chitinilytica]
MLNEPNPASVSRRPQCPLPRIAVAATGTLQQVVVLDAEFDCCGAFESRLRELALVVVCFDWPSGEVRGVSARVCLHRDDVTPVLPLSDWQTGPIDAAVVARLLTGAILIVSHNAAFDRPRLEAALPCLQHVRWACSLREVPWDAFRIHDHSLLALATQYRLHFLPHHAAHDAEMLATILAAPFPGYTTTALWGLLWQCLPLYIELCVFGRPDAALQTWLWRHRFHWDERRNGWRVVLRHDQAELIRAELVGLLRLRDDVRLEHGGCPLEIRHSARRLPLQPVVIPPAVVPAVARTGS